MNMMVVLMLVPVLILDAGVSGAVVVVAAAIVDAKACASGAGVAAGKVVILCWW